jgi:hypothetical protein
MDDFSNRTGAVEKDAGQAWPRGGSSALGVQIPADCPQVTGGRSAPWAAGTLLYRLFAMKRYIRTGFLFFPRISGVYLFWCLFATGLLEEVSLFHWVA